MNTTQEKMTEPQLRVGPILVSDQSMNYPVLRQPPPCGMKSEEDGHSLCVNVDPDNAGPRIWVELDGNGVVTVYLHPDDGDASHVFEWHPKAKFLEVPQA